MYRTEDIYQNLVVKNTIKYDSKQYCELANQFDLLGQFPYESIEKMIGSYFLTNNTYKSYRKYLFFLHKLIGEFNINILFSEDEAPLGCQPNTEISFSANNNGEAELSVLNTIELEDDIAEDSDEFKEYEKLKGKYFMFEKNKNIKGSLLNLSLEQFLIKFGEEDAE